MDGQIIEEKAFNVLREVLEAPELARDDDFFTEGGHSLLVIRVIALLRQRHGLTISARAFIADSRIGAITAAAEVV